MIDEKRDSAAVGAVALTVATSDATASASRQQDMVQEPKERKEEKLNSSKRFLLQDWLARLPCTADAGKTIVLLAGLIAVLVVMHLGPHAPLEKAYVTCATDGCALYAHRLAESLNASAADPCQNFTLFVCDGWRRNNAYSVRQNLTVAALWALSQLAHRVHPPNKGQTAAQRGAAFYRSCDAVLRNDRDELPVVKKLLAEAKIDWPRRPEQPDVLHTLFYTSVRLRWSPFFNIEIDTTTSYATEVFLMPFEDFQLVERKYVSMEKSGVAERRRYFDILCDEFGASQADQTVVSFEEVEDVTQRMLVPLLESLPNERKAETISTAWLHRPGAQPSKARWQSALASYGVPNETVIYETEVLPFVTQFFGLWERYGEAMTEILVSWCTVQVAALYANQRLISNYYGTRDAALFHQGAFCLSKAYLVAGFSVFDPEGSGHTGSYTGDKVANIAFFVRRSFLGRLEGWKHFEPQRAVVADWDSLSVVFSAADGHGAKVVTDNRSYPDMGDSLAENWRDAAVPLRVMRHDAAYVALKSSQYHVVLKHDIVLLPFATALPQYHPNATEAVNYAGLGKEVALALSQSFLDTYILFEPAKTAIETVSSCMGTLHGASLSNNLEVLALGAVFDAYKNITGDEEIRLVGLEQYSASQIFFIASCYAKCAGTFSREFEDCNGALRHFEAFSHAFGCPRNSHMNSARRCHLF
ncbi:hypothetical protein V5799_003811 [Amblyomma americanum]|uniref:Uncharacterized protein n=1 Tax=Amblyomma americanum TaxID=6943 RepID=A0AAQ4D7W7_AMBAM